MQTNAISTAKMDRPNLTVPTPQTPPLQLLHSPQTPKPPRLTIHQAKRVASIPIAKTIHATPGKQQSLVQHNNNVKNNPVR